MAVMQARAHGESAVPAIALALARAAKPKEAPGAGGAPVGRGRALVALCSALARGGAAREGGGVGERRNTLFQ
jgi:hypothetical protein